jgi:hypothetical protein
MGDFKKVLDFIRRKSATIKYGAAGGHGRVHVGAVVVWGYRDKKLS